MPQETLTFPPLYCLVGAYRLAHDQTLWKPMWAKCSKAAKQAGLVGLAWLVFTWPLQRLFVYYFMSASASVTGLSAIYGKVVETADVTDDSLPFRIPVPSLQTFATFMFVIGQVHAIMEFWLRRKLAECRKTAYIQTVKSRGKAADWWTEYVEEFSNPPTQKAIKDAKKQAWYLKLASPLVRFFIMKVFLLPVDFVPFFGMALGAALRSLTYGRLLHLPLFEAKRMSPFQIELWITERQTAYRSFGFVAALMERVPLIGLVFSVSNRIGAAMWAHDLEKRQQRIRDSVSSSAGSSSAIASGSSKGGAVGLEEFKSKPTLKKIYKNVQQDVPLHDDEGESNFNGEGLAVLRRRSDQGPGVFTHLSFTFPLKLISPGVSSRNATLDHAAQAASLTKASPGSTLPASTLASNPSEEGASSATKAKAVNALYVVGYGGGLVSGDSVDLDVDVGLQCCLLILTQGSTKVFKTRTSRPTRGVSTATFSSMASANLQNEQTDDQSGTVLEKSQGATEGQGMTRQNFRFLVRKGATLVLLPDPVTCFASARYDQVQRFDLRDDQTSSCVILDWITPGRTAVPPQSPTCTGTKLDHLDSHTSHARSGSGTGKPLKDYSIPQRVAELWSFSHYRSRNEVRVASNVVARDVILLSQTREEKFVDPITGLSFTELARRNHPYGCYATLILYGLDAQQIIDALDTEFQAIQQRPTTVLNEGEVLWSLSHVQDQTTRSSQPEKAQDGGLRWGTVVVRIAAKDAQRVRRWLFDRLTPLESVIGRDLYRQALAS